MRILDTLNQSQALQLPKPAQTRGWRDIPRDAGASDRNGLIFEPSREQIEKNIPSRLTKEVGIQVVSPAPAIAVFQLSPVDNKFTLKRR